MRRTGAYQEAHDLLNRIIEDSRLTADQLLLAKALHTAAVNDYFLYDAKDQTRQQLEEAIAIMRVLNNEYELANLLAWEAGLVLSTTGEIQQALQWVEEGLQLSEKTRHYHAFCRNIFTKGHCLQRLHRYEEAVICYKQGIESARELGDRQELSIGLASLGDAYNNMGQVDDAYPLWQEALKLSYSTGHRDALIVDHSNLALYEIQKHNWAAAWDHLVKSLYYARLTEAPTRTWSALVTFVSWYFHFGEVSRSAEWIGFLQEKALLQGDQLQLDEVSSHVRMAF